MNNEDKIEGLITTYLLSGDYGKFINNLKMLKVTADEVRKMDLFGDSKFGELVAKIVDDINTGKSYDKDVKDLYAYTKNAQKAFSDVDPIDTSTNGTIKVKAEVPEATSIDGARTQGSIDANTEKMEDTLDGVTKKVEGIKDRKDFSEKSEDEDDKEFSVIDEVLSFKKMIKDAEDHDEPVGKIVDEKLVDVKKSGKDYSLKIYKNKTSNDPVLFEKDHLTEEELDKYLTDIMDGKLMKVANSEKTKEYSNLVKRIEQVSNRLSFSNLSQEKRESLNATLNKLTSRLAQFSDIVTEEKVEEKKNDGDKTPVTSEVDVVESVNAVENKNTADEGQIVDIPEATKNTDVEFSEEYFANFSENDWANFFATNFSEEDIAFMNENFSDADWEVFYSELTSTNTVNFSEADVEKVAKEDIEAGIKKDSPAYKAAEAYYEAKHGKEFCDAYKKSFADLTEKVDAKENMSADADKVESLTKQVAELKAELESLKGDKAVNASEDKPADETDAIASKIVSKIEEKKAADKAKDAKTVNEADMSDEKLDALANKIIEKINGSKLVNNADAPAQVPVQAPVAPAPAVDANGNPIPVAPVAPTPQVPVQAQAPVVTEQVQVQPAQVAPTAPVAQAPVQQTVQASDNTDTNDKPKAWYDGYNTAKTDPDTNEGNKMVRAGELAAKFGYKPNTIEFKTFVDGFSAGTNKAKEDEVKVENKVTQQLNESERSIFTGSDTHFSYVEGADSSRFNRLQSYFD